MPLQSKPACLHVSMILDKVDFSMALHSKTFQNNSDPKATSMFFHECSLLEILQINLSKGVAQQRSILGLSPYINSIRHPHFKRNLLNPHETLEEKKKKKQRKREKKKKKKKKDKKQKQNKQTASPWELLWTPWEQLWDAMGAQSSHCVFINFPF